MKNFKMIAGAMALTAFSALSHAGVAVIANPGLGADAISKEQAEALYIGKSTNIGGVKVSVVDLADGEGARVEFVDKVLGKTEPQLKAFWSRQLFTGKGQPPKQVSSADAVSHVTSNADGVAYVDSAAVPEGVKVLGTF